MRAADLAGGRSNCPERQMANYARRGTARPNNQTAAPNGGYLRTGHGSGPTTERDRTSGLHAARIADSERLAGRLVELRRASVSASSGCPRAGRGTVSWPWSLPLGMPVACRVAAGMRPGLL